VGVTAEPDIASLRAAIRTADEQYYNRGHSDLSDAEYDALFVQLRQLEQAHPELVTEDSPTRRVGAPLPKGSSFPTVPHLEPMGSLESLMDAEAVQDFAARAQKLLALPDGEGLAWACEPKLDGVSANLLYENGVLVRGLSRGDGSQGEDLTRNLTTIRNLPLRLAGPGPFPLRIEIRGEVIMSKHGFALLQEREETSSEGQFRNARNTTAGTLKLQDPRMVKRRPLDFFAFAVGHVDGIAFATHTALRNSSPRGASRSPNRSRASTTPPACSPSATNSNGAATISRTSSTASSPRSTAPTGSSSSAATRARRAGRSPTSSRRASARRACWRSAPRSAAPGR
jgi:DNA ligase (NAD+)